MKAKLTIELTEAEKHHYSRSRDQLLQRPKAIIKDFSIQWLKVVGEIGTPAFEDMPRMWLLAGVIYEPARSGDRDAHNLKLAHDHGRPWELVPFDKGYWVLDEDLTDRILTAGVKGYGIRFLHYYDVEKFDLTLRRVLTGHW